MRVLLIEDDPRLVDSLGGQFRVLGAASSSHGIGTGRLEELSASLQSRNQVLLALPTLAALAARARFPLGDQPGRGDHGDGQRRRPLGYLFHPGGPPASCWLLAVKMTAVPSCSGKMR